MKIERDHEGTGEGVVPSSQKTDITNSPKRSKKQPKQPKQAKENNIVKQFEGFRSESYKCSAGRWTIGYGTTRRADGTPVKPGQVITRNEAEELFQKQYKTFQNRRKYVTVTLSEEQEIALTSFEYNLGRYIRTKRRGHGMNIIRSLNKGDIEGAVKELKRFNGGGGRVIRGLINRREKESKLLRVLPE